MSLQVLSDINRLMIVKITTSWRYYVNWDKRIWNVKWDKTCKWSELWITKQLCMRVTKADYLSTNFSSCIKDYKGTLKSVYFTLFKINFSLMAYNSFQKWWIPYQQLTVFLRGCIFGMLKMDFPFEKSYPAFTLVMSQQQWVFGRNG